MLVIRLQRTGRENVPTYRIVVAEKARPVKGKFLEIVGHYLPAQDPPVLSCKNDVVKEWVSKGARPSNTVARLLKKSGVEGMEKFIQKYTKRLSKKAATEKAAAPAPAPAASAPVAEVKTEAPAAEAPAPDSSVPVAEAKAEAPPSA